MGIRNVFANMDWSYILDMVLSIIPALLCISIHEMCHGLVSYLLGDVTAKTQGRLSLNPLRHIDPVGLLMLIVFKFGWARPVQVNMLNFKKPRRDMALTALAGPVSNILFAALTLFVYGLLFKSLTPGSAGVKVLNLIRTTAFLSIGLGIFNIIPIPPLDGSKVLFSIMPSQTYLGLMRYERYGMLILMILVFTGSLSGYLGSASLAVYNFLFPIAEFAYKLT